MRAWVVCLGVAVLGLGGWMVWRSVDHGRPALAAGPDAGAAAAPEKNETTYPVRSQTVVTQPVHYYLQALGSLQARDVYMLSASVPGTVEHVAFDEGTHVHPGQVLCQISGASYQYAVDRQQAIYDQAVATLADATANYQTAVAQARINLEEANREVERRKSITLQGAVSPEEMQQYQTKADQAGLALQMAQDNAEKGVKNLEAIVAEKLALWNSAKDDLRKASVTAPIDGVIDSRSVTNSQYVTAGAPLAVLVDRSSLKLMFKVPEHECAAIQMGDTVSFTVPAYAGRKFKAKIYFMSNQVDPMTRTVDCYARVTEDLDLLKPGFFAAVEVVTGGNREGIVVPITALLPTEKGFVAFVLEGDLARKRIVTVGLHVTGNRVEVTDGLKAGEELVTEGGNALDDKYKVKVLPGESIDTKVLSEEEAAVQPLPGTAKPSASNADTPATDAAPPAPAIDSQMKPTDTPAKGAAAGPKTAAPGATPSGSTPAGSTPGDAAAAPAVPVAAIPVHP